MILDSNNSYKGVIDRYKQFLPVTRNTPRITLLEGNTPLIHSPVLSEKLGSRFDVYLKYEGLNPTGSFKDRGMTVAIAKAVEEKMKAVICASTGNTSASAAAYSARAGIKCVVVIPEGAIALGKLAQALIHNAKVIAIKGNFDCALEIVKEISANYAVTLVNSINPYRIEGQKTASFEICDYLKSGPNFHLLPVGNAGNITAYWKGYKEYYSRGKISCLPQMLGFQAKGASPIVKGKPFKNPETLATAIRIGNPASWQKAIEAREESGGLIDSATDKQIVSAYKMLAKGEGVFVEPASAASVAGLIKLERKGFFKKVKGKKVTIVCTLTGHGLKDPQIAIKNIKRPPVVKPKIKEVLKISGII
jgi:threonine synthase